MNPYFPALILVVGLFLAMILTSEAGRRIGQRSLRKSPEGATKSAGAAEPTVFALLGLLLAFTFAGAASRFEARRHLIVTEANAISTAYLRLDLLSPGDQVEMRRMFQDYSRLRYSVYRDVNDLDVVAGRLAEASALQDRIWQRAVLICKRPGTPSHVAMLMLPALNEMIDITSTRRGATQNHPPLVIFALLGVLSLVGALLVGYGGAESAKRNWLHLMLFSAILPLTIYVIIDLEFPRLGMVQIDAEDMMLLELPER